VIEDRGIGKARDERLTDDDVYDIRLGYSTGKLTEQEAMKIYRLPRWYLCKIINYTRLKFAHVVLTDTPTPNGVIKEYNRRVI